MYATFDHKGTHMGYIDNPISTVYTSPEDHMKVMMGCIMTIEGPVETEKYKEFLKSQKKADMTRLVPPKKIKNAHTTR